MFEIINQLIGVKKILRNPWGFYHPLLLPEGPRGSRVPGGAPGRSESPTLGLPARVKGLWLPSIW